MNTLYRTSMVLGILLLVILGLNISNQGLNSLTMQTREPVVGLRTQGNTVSIFTLGESHSYDKQQIVHQIMQSWNRLWNYAQRTGDYMLKMTKIIKALLFN